DFFIAMINFYISSHASYFPDLARYGADFAEFIRHYAPAQSLPYLPDVARLEWAWHKVSIAPSSPAINFQKLGECYAEHGERLVFDIPTDFSLLTSQYPIHEIWEKNQPEYQGDTDIVLPDNAIFYYFVCCVHDVMRIDYLTKE